MTKNIAAALITTLIAAQEMTQTPAAPAPNKRHVVLASSHAVTRPKVRNDAIHEVAGLARSLQGKVLKVCVI